MIVQLSTDQSPLETLTNIEGRIDILEERLKPSDNETNPPAEEYDTTKALTDENQTLFKQQQQQQMQLNQHTHTLLSIQNVVQAIAKQYPNLVVPPTPSQQTAPPVLTILLQAALKNNPTLNAAQQLSLQ